jgi:acetyltransferase-like isoleucine patch superfamily enzyme
MGFYTKEAIKGHNIGDYTYGTPTIITYGKPAKLTIGKFCSIARGVKIVLDGEHRSDWVTTYPFTSSNVQIYYPWYPGAKKIDSFTNGNVIIGNDVWVGMDVTILSGSQIGDGAVIGAGSVVASVIQPYSINIGNPCKMTRLRFYEYQIQKLMEIQWWDWPEEKIKKFASLLCSGKIDEFIKEAECAK